MARIRGTDTSPEIRLRRALWARGLRYLLHDRNSTTGEELEYEERPGRQLIAVGGNRLSRGLTLEGLTIAYFLRTTTMADALLQMARWYGFRGGYDDLIRIWTTDGIAEWFVELALVEVKLPRFRGVPPAVRKGSHDAEVTPPIPAGVP